MRIMVDVHRGKNVNNPEVVDDTKTSSLDSGGQNPECVTELNVVESQSVIYCGTQATLITLSFTNTAAQSSNNPSAAASTQLAMATGTDG